jgi:hypothetical protein
MSTCAPCLNQLHIRASCQGGPSACACEPATAGQCLQLASCRDKTQAWQGLNRIGNMLVPNENYCKFEEWLMPLLDTMLDEQVDLYCLVFFGARTHTHTRKRMSVLMHMERDMQLASGKPWTPSSFIKRLGLEINNKESIYYWYGRTSPSSMPPLMGRELLFCLCCPRSHYAFAIRTREGAPATFKREGSLPHSHFCKRICVAA